jgi:hypothetical protein
LRNNGILPNPSATPATVPSPSTVEDWSQGNLTSQRLDKFAATILPSPVQIQLAQQFGKDSVNHSFYAEKCFCHILLPLLKSGFLSCRATETLEKACRRVRQLQQLRKKHQHVNFLPLQGFQADWESSYYNYQNRLENHDHGLSLAF